jgi:hypothetical protein
MHAECAFSVSQLWVGLEAGLYVLLCEYFRNRQSTAEHSTVRLYYNCKGLYCTSKADCTTTVMSGMPS